MRKSWFKAPLILALFTTGCVSAPTESAIDIGEISTTPEAAVSPYDGALACMDEVLLRSGLPPALERRMFATDFDPAGPGGKLGGLTIDPIESAIAKISKRSHAIVAVRQGVFNTVHQGELARARYAVLGNISLENTLGQTVDWGVYFPVASAGHKTNKKTAVMTVRLVLQDLDSQHGSIIGDTDTKTSITVTSRDVGSDLDAKIDNFGAFGEFQISRTQGQHQAAESLIDLAMIKAIGVLTHTDYQQCLGYEPEIIRQKELWAKFSTNERIQSLQSGLSSLGYYTGSADGRNSDDLTKAIRLAQSRLGLIVTGDIDPNLYLRIKQNASHEVERRLNLPRGPRIAPSSDDMIYNRNIRLYVAPKGGRLAFTAREIVDSYFACFYVDSRKRAYKLFPSKGHPDEKSLAFDTIDLPGTGDDFYVLAADDLAPAEFDPPPQAHVSVNFKTVAEDIVCFSSDKEIQSQLPTSLSSASIDTPAITSVPNLIQTVRASVGSGLYWDDFQYGVSIDPGVIQGGVPTPPPPPPPNPDQPPAAEAKKPST